MSQFPHSNLTVATTDEQFAHGYDVGYLQYQLDYCHMSLKDGIVSKTPNAIAVYALIVGTITSVQQSGRFSAGYVTGWIATLLEGPPSSESASTPVPAHVEEVNV